MAKPTFVADFTEGNVEKQLFFFSLPLVMSNLLQVVYNMVDMIIVGHVLGKPGLSAVSIGGDLVNFLTFIVIGFSGAGQVLTAQYVGEDRKDRLGPFIGTMSAFLAVLSLILTLICFSLRDDILRWMHTPAEAWDQALGYETVCILGFSFVCGYNAVSAILRGLGDSKHPFLFVGAAAVLNVILDIYYVIFLGWKAAGAALATVLSQGLSFLFSLVFLFMHRNRLGFSIRPGDFLRMQRNMLISLVSLGVPMAIKGASVLFSRLFVNSWVNSYGIAVSAFSGIAGKFISISNLVSTAVATAGSSMVGQCIGAGKYLRVSQIMAAAYKLSLTTATILSVSICLFPEQIYGFFTADPDVIRIGLTYVPVACLVFFGCASRSGANALINGSGHVRVNFFVAILDGMVLRIGLSLLFGLVMGLGPFGFWLGDSFAGFTPMWVGLIFYRSGLWKTRPAYSNQ